MNRSKSSPRNSESLQLRSDWVIENLGQDRWPAISEKLGELKRPSAAKNALAFIRQTFDSYPVQSAVDTLDLEGLVTASRDDEASVGRERDSLYRAGMTELWHNRRALRQDITLLGARRSRRRFGGLRG